MRTKKELEMTINIIRLVIFVICVIFYFSQVPSGNSPEFTLTQAKSYFSTPELKKKLDDYIKSEGVHGGVKIVGDEKILDKTKVTSYFKETESIYTQFASFYNYKYLFNLGLFAFIYVIVAIGLSKSTYHPVMSIAFASMDFVLCSLLVFWTGGIRGPFGFLYVLPIIHVASQFGFYYGLGTATLSILLIYLFSNFFGFVAVDQMKTLDAVFRTLFPMGSILALIGSLTGYVANMNSPLVASTHIVVDDTKKRLEDVTKKYQEQTRIIQKYQEKDQEFIKMKRELYDINLIIQEIVSEVNMGKLFSLIITKAAEQCEARIGAILMRTQAGDLRVAEKYNLSPISERIFTTRMGEGIPGIVALKDTPVKITKDDEDPRFSFFAKCPERIQNCLCVPMKHREEIKGVIILCNKLTGNSFSDQDETSLTTIAGMASSAIANAKLFKDLEKMNNELEGANKQLAEKNKELAKNIEDSITTLAEALDARDTYTREHSKRVAKYAVALAEQMKLPAKEIERITRGSLLHDIGKIGIPDKILLKPEGLTDEEYETIKTHAAKGAEIIGSVDSLRELIDIVKFHHEKFDGTGYNKLKGDQIPLAARIVAVADTYDAMITDRPYRKGFPPEVALDKMSKFASKQFGMDIFLEFEKMIRGKAFFRSERE